MKNKKTTYLLIALVVVVWGAIILRIVGHLNPKEVPVINYQSVNSSERFFEKDSVYQLNLGYSDPFLKGSYSSLKKPDAKVQVQPQYTNTRRRMNQPVQTKTKEIINWPDVKFSGNIKNDKTSEKLGLLIIDGESYLFRIGEERFGIKLDQLYNDSIMVKYKKEVRTITKQTN